MNTDHLTRQMDLIPLSCLGERITVIGAGAIGSFVTLSLAKMGFGNIKVIDFDTIEVENLNCQFYRRSDIGKKKVVALQELVKDFTGVTIEAIDSKYEKGTFQGIVVSAVDSMAVRRLIWENHVSKALMTKAIIDPRMSIEDALMFVMQPMSPKDADSYAKSLYSDEEAVQARCTAKATMYTALLLSGQVCKAVKDVALNLPYARTTMWSIANDSQVTWRSDK